MCDYCDCRSHDEIAALSADHEVLRGLLGDLTRAADAHDAGAAAFLAARLHDVLHHHSLVEERGLFAELGSVGVDEGYVGHLVHDHTDIHALLARAGGGYGWVPAARALVARLGDHLAEEERDLFPAAHQLLTPAQREGIDARRAASRT